MLTWFLLIIGFAIIALTMVDVLWSTLSTNGGGPIAMRLAVVCWKVARVLFKRFQYHRILEFNTVVILILTFAVWVIPMWLGWTIIYSSVEGVVLHQQSGEPALLGDRAYFAGMTFLTLGTGDFVTVSTRWRLLSLATALNGLVVITLTITYLISVVSAAIDKRRLSVSVNALGESGIEIVKNGWDGKGFDALEDQIQDLATQLMVHAERHQAYPVLQYFHPTEEQVALPTALASLDDTSIILSHCLDPEVRPPAATRLSLRRALDIYIRRIQLQHISAVDEPPPVPDMEVLRMAGIPLVEDDICRRAFEDSAEFRRTLFGLVEAEGWPWPD